MGFTKKKPLKTSIRKIRLKYFLNVARRSEIDLFEILNFFK